MCRDYVFVMFFTLFFNLRVLPEGNGMIAFVIIVDISTPRVIEKICRSSENTLFLFKASLWLIGSGQT